MGGLYKPRDNAKDYVDKTEALVSYTTFLIWFCRYSHTSLRMNATTYARGRLRA